MYRKNGSRSTVDTWQRCDTRSKLNVVLSCLGLLGPGASCRVSVVNSGHVHTDQLHQRARRSHLRGRSPQGWCCPRASPRLRSPHQATRCLSRVHFACSARGSLALALCRHAPGLALRLYAGGGLTGGLCAKLGAVCASVVGVIVHATTLVHSPRTRQAAAPPTRHDRRQIEGRGRRRSDRRRGSE